MDEMKELLTSSGGEDEGNGLGMSAVQKQLAEYRARMSVRRSGPANTDSSPNQALLKSKEVEAKLWQSQKQKRLLDDAEQDDLEDGNGVQIDINEM